MFRDLPLPPADCGLRPALRRHAVCLVAPEAVPVHNMYPARESAPLRVPLPERRRRGHGARERRLILIPVSYSVPSPSLVAANSNYAIIRRSVKQSSSSGPTGPSRAARAARLRRRPEAALWRGASLPTTFAYPKAPSLLQRRAPPCPALPWPGLPFPARDAAPHRADGKDDVSPAAGCGLRALLSN